jgi:hypothetical protein
VGRRIRKTSNRIDPAAANAEEKFNMCPEGHKLPHHGHYGECTSLYCANPSMRKKDKPSEEALAPVAPAEQEPPELEEIAQDAYRREDERLAKADARAKALQKRLKTPVGLVGADAEEDFDKGMIAALPIAKQVILKQLMYGDDKQQMEAADRVLAATGRSKREAASGQGAVIVIQAPQGVVLPWSNRKGTNVQVIDGAVGGSSEEQAAVLDNPSAQPALTGGGVSGDQTVQSGPDAEGHDGGGDSGAGEAVRVPGAETE